MPNLVLAVNIVLVFACRFARTRQLHLTSLAARIDGLLVEPFNPQDPRSFLRQALMGQRSIQPKSFFIRGVVLAVVALCLLPFKGYEPPPVVAGDLADRVVRALVHGTRNDA